VPVLGLVPAPACAQDTFKIAYIDPLSGGGASIGEVGLKTFQFIARKSIRKAACSQEA